MSGPTKLLFTALRAFRRPTFMQCRAVGWSVCWSIDRLVGWLVGSFVCWSLVGCRWVGWSVGWSLGWSVGWAVACSIGCLVGVSDGLLICLYLAPAVFGKGPLESVLVTLGGPWDPEIIFKRGFGRLNGSQKGPAGPQKVPQRTPREVNG